MSSVDCAVSRRYYTLWLSRISQVNIVVEQTAQQIDFMFSVIAIKTSEILYLFTWKRMKNSGKSIAQDTVSYFHIWVDKRRELLENRKKS